MTYVCFQTMARHLLLPSMAHQLEDPDLAYTRAWLTSRPDSPLSICYQIPAGTTRIGRAPDNDLIIQGPNTTTVSLHHLAIDCNGECRIRDLESTNGTFVNGERITETTLSPNSSVRLGSQGPELYFTFNEPALPELSQTEELSQPEVMPQALTGSTASPPPESSSPYEHLLAESVERARQARARGAAGQTMTIMREVMHRALRHSGRRFRRVLAVLAAGLFFVSSYATWKTVQLNREKSSIDRHINELEVQLQRATDATEADRLVTQLDSYEGAGSQLERHILYRMVRPRVDFVTDEIRGILAEFGSEVYSVPPELSERVTHYIRQYQGPDRPLMALALGSGAGEVSLIRRVIEQEHLPGDLAYLPVVESAMRTGESRMGAVGLWQLTPATARAYGLRVSEGVDERTNVTKATQAACRFLRQLILEFGSGSSAMLALAAYNSGPAKVKQAVQKASQDPIKQRSFWYLYRVHALPEETREYVPKAIAAIVIGRNPSHFGFNAASASE
jgi:pSer/pThr/pTyr-binding forkhead associated (FHA) protein